MKRSIREHEQLLGNYEAYLADEEKKWGRRVQLMEADFAKMRADIAKLRAQIERAKRAGKDMFDDERYAAN